MAIHYRQEDKTEQDTKNKVYSQVKQTNALICNGWVWGTSVWRQQEGTSAQELWAAPPVPNSGSCCRGGHDPLKPVNSVREDLQTTLIINPMLPHRRGGRLCPMGTEGPGLLREYSHGSTGTLVSYREAVWGACLWWGLHFSGEKDSYILYCILVHRIRIVETGWSWPVKSCPQAPVIPLYPSMLLRTRNISNGERKRLVRILLIFSVKLKSPHQSRSNQIYES